MKRLAILLLLLVLFITGSSVHASGISVSSNNGDTVAVMRNIKINRTTTGNIVVVMGDLDIEGNVFGNVLAIMGNVKVDSRVTGQIVSVLGDVELTEGAEVYGSVISVIGAIKKAGGARIIGEEMEIIGQSFNVKADLFLFIGTVLTIVFSVFTLLIGLLLITVSKEKYVRISSNIEKRTGRKILMGFLGFIGLSILALVLFITLVVPVIYVILLIIGGIFSSIYFGKVILGTLNAGNNVYGGFITGLTTITLIKVLLILFVPQSGFVLNVVLYFLFTAFIDSLGIGIMLDSWFSRRES
ncbi:MAG TPA: hypothetical protein GXX14_08875 [Clostridiaceae bacterium]|nr:hypothetical protein [Clostridiaceae bacterium]